MEDCRIVPPDVGHGLAVSSCSEVILIRVEVAPGPSRCQWMYYFVGDGMNVDGASVYSYGCRFVGGDGGWVDSSPSLLDCYPQAAGAGVRSTDVDDFLFFSDCELVGGQSSGCYDFGSNCVCKSGGTGLHITGRAVLLDSTATGGPPYFDPWDPPCGPIPNGSDFVGTPEFLPGRALRVTTNSPVREAGLLTFHIEGPPHVPVSMGYAGSAEVTHFLDLLRGVLLLPLGPATSSVWLGITDANGVLDVAFPFPMLLPGVESALTFLQFAYMETPALPGGFKVLPHPAVRKEFVLGAGSMITVLDGSF